MGRCTRYRDRTETLLKNGVKHHTINQLYKLKQDKPIGLTWKCPPRLTKGKEQMTIMTKTMSSNQPVMKALEPTNPTPALTVNNTSHISSGPFPATTARKKNGYVKITTTTKVKESVF